ncbi:hypothetical protein JOD57_004041 [Geodermatophilus bullaregiensis]|nr:hypothetical protein [Geodermatophilus bullaregiensis]MBM7808204.1 hypothetical protein [Geodermatophilus bullaregiensis]
MTRAAADDDATMSAVNYSEVLQKTARVGIAAEEIARGLDELDITVTPFGRLHARLAASFYRHRSNLSLADRCRPGRRPSGGCAKHSATAAAPRPRRCPRTAGSAMAVRWLADEAGLSARQIADHLGHSRPA